MPIKKVSFPHMGNYYVAIKPAAGLLGDEVIVPPPITRRTIELGFKYSPEAACVPFKYNVGNYIEALEKGANTLIQASTKGACRFSFYGEVQKEILKKLGYKFEFIQLNSISGLLKTLFNIKKDNPRLSYNIIFKTILLSYQRLRAIEKNEDFIRKNIGFEKEKGTLEKIYQEFLKELDKTPNIKAVKNCSKKYLSLLKKTEIEKPDNCLKVGVVGEFYLVQEPFSNFYLEKELGKKGVEVHRFINFSHVVQNLLYFNYHLKKLFKHSRPYLKYHIGGHGTESVAIAHKLIKQGIDGIIHIKPFGCMPEVNAMSALYKMSKDYKVPITYFSFDAQTSEAGVRTRLEAFYDMLSMRRKNGKTPTSQSLILDMKKI